jgi:hypothetical protein
MRYHRKLHKDLYNSAVSNRFTQYQKFGRQVDYFEQQNSLPAFKEVVRFVLNETFVGGYSTRGNSRN